MSSCIKSGHMTVPLRTGPQYATLGALMPATPLIQKSTKRNSASIAKTVAVSCRIGNWRICRWNFTQMYTIRLSASACWPSNVP